ncbi:MAG TPA: type II toxin-antitoxin system RelE/ParE family toxin [Rubrivivax sp.]|nr:type II toxin-antitoxin system RelE/ParE family toxin [Rubrivivax sp.]
MSYWLHEEAQAELDAATAFYAERATPRVAIAFLEEFERVIELLQLNQQLGTRRDDGMRLYRFRRFPYSLAYREDEDAGPQVYAIAHQNREPGYWQGRQ